ncbi:MAG: 30S ribosomal protein S20 [Planctomycetota bacterium]|nr:30S ribosomal protein S20 [Planctomycetota bacterium]
MPNTASARKRVRQSAKRRSLNNWRKRRIKAQTRTFLKAVQEQNIEQAEAEFRKACALLDKTACTSTLHRNTVARRKSNLARRLNGLKQAATSG